MQNTKYIKSFSRGQITIPKDIREQLGLPEEFWMEIFVDKGKIIVEPLEKKASVADRLKRLASIDTSWFTDEDYDDYQKVRQEMDEHVDKNSL